MAKKKGIIFFEAFSKFILLTRSQVLIQTQDESKSLKQRN
jgi:hypothetical protein